MKTLALLLALTLGALALQEPPAAGQAGEQHKWLQQLVGEWTGKSEVTMVPGSAPMTVDVTENVRSIGGLWVVGEGTAVMGSIPFATMMTVGYDLQSKAFVGTWIDTMQTHLWVYKGQLDSAKKVLTLEADGPSFEDPSKMAKYRDAIELKDADHKTLTSSVQGADGKWTTFQVARYERKKK